jgi:predicted NACHT family NTPase
MEEAPRPLEETQPIPPEEAIARHDRLAVLGEAGAGKSTLLRHLAWEQADDPESLLPLLIPLGRADALISQTGCSFLEAALDLLTEHRVGKERETLKLALVYAIWDRKVLFLCDGLDEVHLARRSVVAGLEKLAADGQCLVVTSRPLGYERLAGLEHFQVLPLLPEDAQAFSDRWFRALAAARGVPEAERETWAAERANWLQRQLEERPGLREVARNPLLLTFLAVLAGDEPQRDLPPRRKELYREYVERPIQ